jgi:hypothetical protein
MPYRKPYSLLPNLVKLQAPVFEVCDARERYLEAKRTATHQRFLESNMCDSLYETICNYIKTNYPLPIEGNFDELVMQMQEDLAIVRIDKAKDWVAAAHISLPTGWNPAHKIGRSFAEVHEPIPGMRLDNGYKLMKAMVQAKEPFERYVWGVIFEDRLNGHPDTPKKPFDPNHPKIWVKYERQVMIGFPQHDAALFSIRLKLIPESRIDKPALIESLKSMTKEQRIYKGIENSYGELLTYLYGIR